MVIPKSNILVRSLKARYTSNEESPCPQDIMEDDSTGSIDIPGLQPAFSQNYYCKMKLTLKSGETIVFNISTLLIRTEGSRIAMSYPLIFKDNFMNSDYSNNLTNYIHAQSHIRGSIIITQNSYYRIKKLKMSYKKYACGGLVTVGSGKDIKYPQIDLTDNDGGQVMCVWTLQKYFSSYNGDTSREYKLIGNFSFTDTCENEYLEIVEGQWKNRNTAIKICKDSSVDNFKYVITKRVTLVIYKTNHYRADKSAFYLEIAKNFTCSSETMVTGATTSITIDENSYTHNQECSWIFNSNPGLYLQIQFLGRFFIENSPNCSKDYLEVQHFDNGLWVPEARFCGREVAPLYNTQF